MHTRSSRRLSSKRYYKLPVVTIMLIRVKHIPDVIYKIMLIRVKHIPDVIYKINAMQIELISCADISEI